MSKPRRGLLLGFLIFMPGLASQGWDLLLWSSGGDDEFQGESTVLQSVPPRIEMDCFSGQKVPTAQSVSDQREMVPRLNWGRKSNCKAMGGDGTYQKKKEKLSQQLLETRAGEDRLAHGEGCLEQHSHLEVKQVLQQGVKGDEDHLEDGVLLGQKEGLDTGSWTLDFESESIHEEIYWGCFYFFPWLRMCRKDKREQA